MEWKRAFLVTLRQNGLKSEGELEMDNPAKYMADECMSWSSWLIHPHINA